ncbi:hypothetical protein [Geoalkalibacter halelectricus]|uniref:Uncharacterized protein n=1 Tax=Geoalkalibacter halelectricus TaxID=2847045 RepID=A0ABY5ZRF9_9BACT|nr:hypothetical protein [Geoalkalibacter halelectricus]MDO3377638.1 hypothetical protein [Geoalkalibacter halelectricus]UWZ81429.1 hypothetical protein L9S41_08540 [Geoalkalibacter halelectricus]
MDLSFRVDPGLQFPMDFGVKHSLSACRPLVVADGAMAYTQQNKNQKPERKKIFLLSTGNGGILKGKTILWFFRETEGKQVLLNGHGENTV